MAKDQRIESRNLPNYPSPYQTHRSVQNHVTVQLGATSDMDDNFASMTVPSISDEVHDGEHPDAARLVPVPSKQAEEHPGTDLNVSEFNIIQCLPDRPKSNLVLVNDQQQR